MYHKEAASVGSNKEKSICKGGKKQNGKIRGDLVHSDWHEKLIRHKAWIH